MFLLLFLPFKFLFLLQVAAFQSSSSSCLFLLLLFVIPSPLNVRMSAITLLCQAQYVAVCLQSLNQVCSCLSIQDCGFSAHFRPWWSIRCVCTSRCLSSCGSQPECGYRISWPLIATSTSCSSSAWPCPTFWSSWPFLSLTGPKRTASLTTCPTGLASRSVTLLVSAGQNECSWLKSDYSAAPNFVYIRFSQTVFRGLFVGGPWVSNDCSSVGGPASLLY